MKMDEKLEAIFQAKLGDNWCKEITLKLRADTLYWIVYLAQLGIEMRRQKEQAKGHPHGGLATAEGIASIASWQMDLEKVVEQVEKALIK
jgi:hypothetical protein